ncbi:ParB/RepB/Spo0J family partition protein [Thermococcus thioreducens]|uniref:IMP dehydrogenase n=1 Tax=Thermococcus thioreducens TaxID=277988 RepID=A0A0Q2XMF6_9EURY|nr:ParB/RepB/Spo0J family partition protein [Thermococcus thioreducens]ASJ12583.1 inosine-5-monophosphate dehydrogenase [Thermococcus thioreducens]KQH82420.1 inosine-5-monophosphate dehydrogenase [Thermococcus thioreducens]SEV88321.1 IMP dehydrogenase [Thermococcus thioreducens]
MRRIRLITREEAWKRAERIKREYEAIYGIKFELEAAFIPLASVVPTQAALSEVKLLVVLQEIKHGYNAPVIVIPHGSRYYLIDGHHRAFALKKLGFDEVEAILIRPEGEFMPGVAKTAEKEGLKRLEDVKIVRD